MKNAISLLLKVYPGYTEELNQIKMLTTTDRKNCLNLSHMKKYQKLKIFVTW